MVRVLETIFFNASKHVLNYYKRKLRGVSFSVFGCRATGKSTLIKRIRGEDVRLNAPPEPTRPGPEKIDKFEISILGDREYSVKKLFDVSGEKGAWHRDWCQVYTETKPRGLIILLDHKNFELHRRALNFVIDMIQTNEPGWWFRRRKGYMKARNNLRAIFILINKQDLWEKDMTRDQLLSNFSHENERFERLVNQLPKKVLYSVRVCSAKYGDGINQIMQDFIHAIA